MLSLMTSSCGIGGASEKKTFESLLLLVEEGESILESEIIHFEPAQRNFLECLNSEISPIGACESLRSRLEVVFDETLVEFQFQGLIAELNSLKLSSSDDASLARDEFVKHLRAWRQYISDFRYSMPSSFELSSNDLAFLDTWADVYENSQITETFDALCSGLGNAQPSSTDEFSARIIDICND
jgi:hypothetical protein